jgi:hypothetical protein
MLTSTSGMIQRSWLPPLTSPTKAEWPDPELSLGRQCRSLGRNKCWEVTGPAQAVLDCIFPKVKCLLESRNEYLNEKEPIPVAIIFGLYMIGRSEKKSNPTLLFTCEKKAPRQKALNMVMESGLLSPYPGVLLAESARSPLACQPAVSLASCGDMLHGSKRVFDIYLETSPHHWNNLSGILVNIQSRHEGPRASRSATIGGLVYSEDGNLTRTYYGITVAHAFSHIAMGKLVQQNNDNVEDDDSVEEDDTEFAFYGQRNDDEEEDEEFIEMTSKGDPN